MFSSALYPINPVALNKWFLRTETVKIEYELIQNV